MKTLKHDIASQLGASVTMLEACIVACPDDVWAQGRIGDRFFWEVAFHVAWYAHLYLTPPGEDHPGMPPWAWPHAAGMGNKMEPPFEPLAPEELGPVLDREHVAAYVADIRARIGEVLARETEETFAGESGFFWLNMTRLSTYLYNLRHIQHHTGQLSATLRWATGVGVGWTGMADDGSP